MIFNNDNLIPHIKQVLTQELPGRSAHLKMFSRIPQYQIDVEPPEDARVAAVLIHLYFDTEWKLTLMERTDRGRHSGQISFPGGGVEEQDVSLVDTALREASEEVGIIPDQVEILGQLSKLYIPVSNSLVHPFVGYSAQPPRYKLDPEEVKTVVEATFSDFFDADKLKQKDLTVGSGMRLKEISYFDINGHVVWGATAMIMSEFLTAIQQHHEINS